MERIEQIRKGIAAYKHEQAVIVRLLRKRKQFTELEFDRWFKWREYRRHVPLRGGDIMGDSFILGMGINGGNIWATYLDLMQHMMAIGIVDAKTENGIVTYKLL